VAIDPSATTTGDEAGIIAAGRTANGHAYVLDDRSVQGSPHTWGSRAVQCYHAHKADRVVAEVNNGGEMVELTLRTVDPTVSYKAVHASRGKRTRAEPVAALYEQGKVHHVGTFPQLEDEMCDWEPDASDSPNRMDALVWALTELMLGDQRSRKLVTW
jgi:phage terminase large subunit-like protein